MPIGYSFLNFKIHYCLLEGISRKEHERTSKYGKRKVLLKQKGIFKY